MVKETMLVLCLDIYFSLELCLDLTVGLQQLAFGSTESCLRQAFSFSFAKRKKEKILNNPNLSKIISFLSENILKN